MHIPRLVRAKKWCVGPAVGAGSGQKRHVDGAVLIVIPRWNRVAAPVGGLGRGGQGAQHFAAHSVLHHCRFDFTPIPLQPNARRAVISTRVKKS